MSSTQSNLLDASFVTNVVVRFCLHYRSCDIYSNSAAAVYDQVSSHCHCLRLRRSDITQVTVCSCNLYRLDIVPFFLLLVVASGGCAVALLLDTMACYCLPLSIVVCRINITPVDVHSRRISCCCLSRFRYLDCDFTVILYCT